MGKYFKVKHCVALNSCTAALHLALAVNNLRKKESTGSSNDLRYMLSVLCGLDPVVDIDPKTLVMIVILKNTLKIA